MHLSKMSQFEALCENCKRESHHSIQKIENCNCPCNNKIMEAGTWHDLNASGLPCHIQLIPVYPYSRFFVMPNQKEKLFLQLVKN
jgi:hypothetical protein